MQKMNRPMDAEAERGEVEGMTGSENGQEHLVDADVKEW